VADFLTAVLTEFNRNPPPLADFAFFGASAIIHAADDRSVAETVRVLPAIMDSAAALCPGVGLWPGPLAIAPTVNPYGPGLATTDGTTRTCLAARDPRHGALFGAAHLVAALAGTISGAEVLAPLHASGPIGLVAPDRSPWPLAFVHAAVAGGRGAALREAPSGEGTAGIAWESGDRWTILLANLSEDPVEVACPPGLGSVERLGPGASGWISETAGGPTLRLDPYATLRLTGAAC